MALNPSIAALVVEIKAFAVAQGFSEKRAFQVALTRLCKQWAAGQTTPQAELQAVMDAHEKLQARRGDLTNLNINSMSSVATAHQSEVDALVAAGAPPE